ncbi:6724_t:CDS:2 [Diversispora eburnea]|uniref:Galactose-1-phosphate uridylyltransferase n=1 Tax=Diversispora eburnea TaxID=1213867 RepID=A0A9N8VHQ1_9GLOM|nr:6724_t:CDS:2 [Diversispora eburnea]
MNVELDNYPHRRFNPLTNSWILCSPHRAKRPWQGQQETLEDKVIPEHDSQCYLCPRNSRANGNLNPNYSNTFVFDNDYAALINNQPKLLIDNDDESNKSLSSLLKVEIVRGECKVICFSPKHNITIAEMTEEDIIHVIQAWTKIYQNSFSIPFINYVQIFENKGSIMGCSNPHPHCQVWSSESIPEEISKELKSMTKYYEKNNSCLLYELEKVENGQKDLSNIIRNITCRYDNIFQCSFPYSMGIHQAPVDNMNHSHDSHLHLHFYPPLLRSATVKKFLVGYELLAEPQRDITPEYAASILQKCSEIHYKSNIHIAQG